MSNIHKNITDLISYVICIQNKSENHHIFF